MTKQINVKVVCACGEEVTAKDDLKEEIKIRIQYAFNGLLTDQDFLNRAAESIVALFEEDRPAELFEEYFKKYGEHMRVLCPEMVKKLEDGSAEEQACRFYGKECLTCSPAEPERWKPEPEESYWYVTMEGDIQTVPWSGFSRIDSEAWEYGNCFKTHEQAEQAREKIKEVLLHIHDAAV